MSFFKKTMLYLGLGPDEAYDEFGRPPADHADEVVVRPIDGRRPVAASPGRPSSPRPTIEAGGGHVRPENGPGPRPSGRGEPASPIPSGVGRPVAVESARPRLVAKPVTSMPTGNSGGAAPDSSEPRTVRAIPSLRREKPQVVTPNSFNDAQEVGDRFKRNQPVIVNLQGTDRDLSRRLIDFISGLCYGLGGQMERVAKQVYLLTPADVEVSAEDRRELREQGLHAP